MIDKQDTKIVALLILSSSSNCNGKANNFTNMLEEIFTIKCTDMTFL